MLALDDRSANLLIPRLLVLGLVIALTVQGCLFLGGEEPEEAAAPV
jgi:hypothetical protein